MPPWHADAPTGTFSNERKLTSAEKATLERWAAGGAPEGDPTELKPAPTFADGWRIGKPDAIFEMQEDYPVAGERDDPVRALLHPDQLHRSEVAEGDRGTSGKSRRRASHPRLLRGAAGWPARPACDPAES